MDVRDLVAAHYSGTDLAGAIVSRLADAGVDTSSLSAVDLLLVDQLHTGGADATAHLLERAGIGRGMHVLDLGCGIGGTSRMVARTGADVTGIDLAPDFVDAANDLTERVGLEEHARFVATAGEELPFEDGSFDAAVMVHVGMNLPDKAAVFGEVHRVLRPGAVFGMFEQMRTGPGALPYPMPWAEDERSSFVETPEEYAEALRQAGFEVLEVEDRTTATATPPPPGFGPVMVFGPVFAERVGNNVRATQADMLGAVLVLARA